MIVITGATGTVGRPLIALLKDQGVSVRAVARSVEAGTLPAGVEAVTADLTRPQSLAPALEGASAPFVHPRAVGENGGKLLALATEQGVRRVVALSATNVDDDPAYQRSRFNGDRDKEVEDAAANSGLPWVAVRSNSFATNTIGMLGAQARAGDVARGPYATFAEALTHESDLAAVIADALLDDDLDGRPVAVTGSRSLTHEEPVIGEVIGRPLRFQEVPPEAAARGLVANGVPEPLAAAVISRYARGAGQPALVTDKVEIVLGRPARTFAEWVTGHTDTVRAVAA